MSVHQFDIDIAKEYGIPYAVLYEVFLSGSSLSCLEVQEEYSYIGTGKIKTALRELEKNKTIGMEEPESIKAMIQVKKVFLNSSSVAPFLYPDPS